MRMEDGKMVRPSWDEYFAKIVDDVSKRSTCTRRQIGSLIVNNEHEIVSTGFNGNVRGAPHCDDIGCIKDEMKLPSGSGHDWCTAVHAEQNALLQAGKAAKGAILYVNGFPCKICARLIVNAGIKKVVISGEYPSKEGLDILSDAGIETVHIRLNEV